MLLTQLRDQGLVQFADRQVTKTEAGIPLMVSPVISPPRGRRHWNGTARLGRGCPSKVRIRGEPIYDNLYDNLYDNPHWRARAPVSAAPLPRWENPRWLTGAGARACAPEQEVARSSAPGPLRNVFPRLDFG